MKTVVSVIGKDAVGIIADVSAICRECNANILDINVAASMIGDTTKTALRHYAEATEEKKKEVLTNLEGKVII